MTALMESAKRKMGGDKDNTSQDGGQYPELYETGSALKYTPITRDHTLVGYWSFEEGSGNATSTDYSGNNNNGTWYGTSTHYGTGKVGTWAGSFNGSSDYVTFPSIDITGTDFTRSAWIYPKKSCYINDDAVRWFIFSTGRLRSSANGDIDGSTGNITFNAWNFVVSVYINATQELTNYVNGVQISSGTAGDITSAIAFEYGKGLSAPEYFDGTIDDVRIYNRALSAAEIQALYNVTQ